MCFGPFARVCHWGPLTALGVIKCVTGMTIHCSSMWWPAKDIGGILNTLCFMSLSGLTLYNFLSSIYHGPGYLPLNWKPEDESAVTFLQWCGVCQGYKAPRAHHCRKCGRCVLKMDHHCPWINNCVGWGNHAHFTAFLLYAVLGCLHAAVILSCSLYRALYRVRLMHYGYNVPVVHLGLNGIILCVFSLGLAIGVILAVGMLLFFQVRAIVRNRTGIEDWIVEKAYHRRQNTNEVFIYPYDLGYKNNIKQVVNFTCHPVGDGITWDVREGCDQYTLTREQVAQKSEKRHRTKLYSIIRSASGSWLPIRQGFLVCIHPPCTDEPRIKLEVGDTVLVTRWRKYWLFGEKVQKDIPEGQQSVRRVRGWFPRKCAVEMIGGESKTFSDKKRK